jgi:hypothetical protein
LNQKGNDMNIKKSVIAGALAALAMGVSSQASAYVYAAAGLTIQNFQLAITGSPVTVTRFDFTLTNTATLNGNSAINTATCGGTPGPGNNNCTPTLGRMDADATNAPGSAPVVRTNNAAIGGEFTFFGATAANLVGNWANSDSVIDTAELVNLGQPTNTRNIAEALLTSGADASSLSSIQSTTGFTIQFQVEDGASLSLNFLADPDLRAAIFGESSNGSYSAGADLNASFTLSQNTPTGEATLVNWNPQGTTTNDCVAVSLPAGVTCEENADSEDLNFNVGTTANNTADDHSWDPNVLTAAGNDFGITVQGLRAGTYTLKLNEVKSTAIARTVPEPGMLALMGIGLMGFVASVRRKKKAV